ncbi:MAG: electron transport complex subunit RsxB [Pseudomonadota bacterium]
MGSPHDAAALVEAIDAALPQTQCTRCGYVDCLAYAQAIAAGRAAINQCPPGGAEGIERLARITGLTVRPLNPAHGQEAPRQVAVIDENWCIGCTLCIKACPVDSIVGAAKLMHTVVSSACTGCELCLPVCPVDCIGLVPVTGERTGWQAWDDKLAHTARERYQFRQERAHHTEQDNQERLAAQAQLKRSASGQHTHLDNAALARKRRIVEAAMARSQVLRKP